MARDRAARDAKSLELRHFLVGMERRRRRASSIVGCSSWRTLGTPSSSLGYSVNISIAPFGEWKTNHGCRFGALTGVKDLADRRKWGVHGHEIRQNMRRP
jgi:hypothetical protein